MGYGLWLQNPCKLTREIQNYMAYEGVWLMPGMGYTWDMVGKDKIT